MGYDNILYGVEGRIATITLNRPEKRNALNPGLRRELVDALGVAERDDDVTLILLQGAGVAFCAGYDMNGYASGSAEPERPRGWHHSAQLTGNSVTGSEAARMGWIAKSFPPAELDAQVMRELRPVAQSHPAMLAANKLALNQTYEVMGMRAAMQSSVPWYVLARDHRPGSGQFQDLAASEGLKTAIAWRDRAFKTEGFPL